MPPSKVAETLSDKLIHFIRTVHNHTFDQAEKKAKIGSGFLSRIGRGHRPLTDEVALKVLTKVGGHTVPLAKTILAKWKAEVALASLPSSMAAELMSNAYNGPSLTELEQAPANKIDRLAIKLEKQHPVIFKKRPLAEMTTEQKRSVLIAYYVSLGAE